jgi:ubiquitin-like modifier-activating enzyme ATG7
VAGADAVFLLTDTREARWLPALAAASLGRLAITAAIGFDTFLVMRHGEGPGPAAGDAAAAADATAGADAAPSGGRLGCYFCQDVVAPLNSTRDRTLDQQCTVARPGLAHVAGALAAELLAAVVAHPAGAAAPAEGGDDAGGDYGAAAASGSGGVLGGVPHMVRGRLSGFRQTCMSGRAFSQCTACSPAVVARYRAEGAGFVLAAARSPAVLEAATGLDALQAAAEAMMLSAGEEGDGSDGERGGGRAGKGGGGSDGSSSDGSWQL